jgi:phosphoglycolate phosphatase
MGNSDVVGHVHRLLVFDLDGTLVDSRQDLVDSANALIEERGGAALPADAIAKMVGEGAVTLVRRALEAAHLPPDEAAVERFLKLYDDRLLRTTRPYAGIPHVLEELAGEAVLGVLTNKPLAPARKLLDALELSPFLTFTIGGDGPLPRKPDPGSLRLLMSRYGVAVRDTALIGDSRIDFETARAAGTAVCLVRYGFGYEQFPVATLRGDEGLADTAADIPRVVRMLLANPSGSS